VFCQKKETVNSEVFFLSKLPKENPEASVEEESSVIDGD
jgi:hypothetical protein